MVKIDKSKVIDEYTGILSALKNDKMQDFINLSKYIKNNKKVYLVSSYLSFTRWADDSIKMASTFKLY